MDKPDNSEQYRNDGQQRILSLIRTLAGNEIVGMAPAQIAQLQECSPSAVTRDLANLKLAGMAEQVPDTGHWRLAPEIVQIAIKHARALERAQNRLAEVTQRFSRSTD